MIGKFNFQYIIDLFKAMNASWASRIFSLCLIVALVYGYVNRGGTKKGSEGLTTCQEINKILVSALKDVRTEMSTDEKPVTMSAAGSLLSFASFVDTIPAKNVKVINRIDSALRYIDSLSRIKKQSTKN